MCVSGGLHCAKGKLNCLIPARGDRVSLYSAIDDLLKSKNFKFPQYVCCIKRIQDLASNADNALDLSLTLQRYGSKN